MTHDIGLIYAGKTFCLPVISVSNTTHSIIPNVILEFNGFPTGVTYLSHAVDRGSFDPADFIWNIGSLAPLEKLYGTFCFTVQDGDRPSFAFYFKTNRTDACASCEPNKDGCIIVDGMSVRELVEAGVVVVEGIFHDDAHAASNSLPIGRWYELSDLNTMGLPPGQVKKRTV